MKIEVHTKEIDPHTEVFALDVDEASLQRLQYGEVGSPHPYVKVSDVTEALQPKAPRTDKERMDLIDDEGYTYCYHICSGAITGRAHRFVALFSPEGQQVTDTSHAFETLREALDYVLDMEEIK